jgi:hypothetical protein
MNTLTLPGKPSEVIKRAREVYAEREPPQPQNPATWPGTEAISDARIFPPLSLHSLVRDSHGAHLENFPFAIMMFAVLLTGVTAVVWGILLTSAWLAAIGFSLTLVGCALYGWSLYDE